MKKKKVWISLLITLTLGIWFTITKSSSEEVISIDAEKVELRTIVQKINASGKIQPEESVQITSTITGWITKITVMEGIVLSLFLCLCPHLSVSRFVRTAVQLFGLLFCL